MINIELDTEGAPNYAWVWGGSRPAILTGENDQMTTESDNVIEYKKPDQKNRFEVMFMISLEVEANDKEHARQVAKDEFEFSDLNYADILVKPLDSEATE